MKVNAYNPRAREVETGGFLGLAGHSTYNRVPDPNERPWQVKNKIK